MKYTSFRRFIALSILVAVTWSAQATLNLEDSIPVGPQVKLGKLDNGLTYYIHKNRQPAKRLELRLVVKAGSILEDDDQLGLAHYTEHMAFNGSTHFKKHELVSYLQSIGLKFGGDLNAYTGFDETVYILPIPTDKRENIEKAFLVLEDWAQGISFKDNDIESERGIILEEFRLGRGVEDRVNKVVLPKTFGGSLYAKHLPIGTEASLKSFQFDALKRFYKDWYRPDLMAVIVVGDIDIADAENLIKEHLGKLRNPPNPRPRKYISIPARNTEEAVIVTDKEAVYNIVQVLYPITEQPIVRTVSDYRNKLTEDLFGAMLGQRIRELTQQSNPPFIGGVSGLAPMIPSYRAFNILAILGRGGVEPAVQALISENQRIRKFGFQAAELERQKKAMLRGLEQFGSERETTNSATYAAEYIRNFLVNESIPGIDAELRYAQELLPTISLADVNGFARDVIPAGGPKLVVYAGNEKESNTPTISELLSAASRAETLPLVAKTESQLPANLMEKLPTPGTLISETRNAELGTTEWILSNGVKVILKPTDFKNDDIRMAARRPGGQSLYGLEDKFNAHYASDIVDAMGLASYSPIDLEKILAGKDVSVSTRLNSFSEAIYANSGVGDLETMLQIVHLKFTDPRRDEGLYQSAITRLQDGSRNAVARPEAVLDDAVRKTLFGEHPRLWLTPRPQDFDSVSLERILTIYRDRFASAKGFTFIFVGSVTRGSALPLVLKYLASLPTSYIEAEYNDVGIHPVKGVWSRKVYAGVEPKSIVSVQFAGDSQYSEDDPLRLQALIEVLNLRIMDELREKQSLIYGASVNGDLYFAPSNYYQLGFQLPCAPENVEKVATALFGEIDKLQKLGPDAGDLAKVKKNWLISHRRSLRQNNYWSQKLENVVVHNADPNRILRYEEILAAMNAGDIQEAAKRYLRRDNYVQVVLYPEAK